jgi:serine/threonine protein kinase
MIHRDIKPENIMASPSGAKLGDFGLVKTIVPSNSRDDEDVVAATQKPGMPHRYRTPELITRARGESQKLTTASDIYQMGTVLYELITGYNPRKPAKNILDSLELDLRDMAREKGADITHLVGRMLDDDPVRRPDAVTCLNEIDEIHKGICYAIFGITSQPW